ncbi:AsmA-like C-terminal region-containing protein, partial [Litorisediminicola beolgyonensis]
ASLGGGGGGGGGSVPVSVALDRFTISEGIALEGLRGDFTASGGLSGRFTARMAGTGAPIEGRLVPQNGGTAIEAQSSDAGRVLLSTGILKSVEGGAMTLRMVPVAGAQGQYDGQVVVQGPRLTDAPAIASLFDAVSVVGLIDQLEGPGIFFSEVDARFRLTPSRLVLAESSAVGPSMGLSLDGYYDLAQKRLDMQGVFSPIYVLNGIGSLFTRRGEGLLGFNFTLTGPASQPQVAVNPLSVFTPAMFREIFRRPPPNPRGGN